MRAVLGFIFNMLPLFVRAAPRGGRDGRVEGQIGGKQGRKAKIAAGVDVKNLVPLNGAVVGGSVGGAVNIASGASDPDTGLSEHLVKP